MSVSNLFQRVFLNVVATRERVVIVFYISLLFAYIYIYCCRRVGALGHRSRDTLLI